MDGMDRHGQGPAIMWLPIRSGDCLICAVMACLGLRLARPHNMLFVGFAGKGGALGDVAFISRESSDNA